MGKCEGCVFWEGDESTYRAKCKKHSNERQISTTAFDESCKEFSSRSVKPPLVVPDMQSQVRGIYTGISTYSVPINGHLTKDLAIDIEGYIQARLLKVMSDEFARIEDEILYGFPVKEVQGIISTPPDVDWSQWQMPQPNVIRGHFLEIEYTRDLLDFGPSPPASLWTPRINPVTITGRMCANPDQLLGFSLGANTKLEFIDSDGTSVEIDGFLTSVTMDDEGCAIEFSGGNGTLTRAISTQPLDDEDDDHQDEEEEEWDDDGWDFDEDDNDLNDEEDLDKEEEDEGYGGNRRYYL